MIKEAIRPFRVNKDIIEGASECVPILEGRGKAHPFDLILAVMSIARDYPEDLEAIENLSTRELFEKGIDNKLMENIRKILVGMRKSSAHFSMDTIDAAMKKHYFKLKRNLFSSEFDENFEPARKCYRSILSLIYGANQKFFINFSKGCMVATDLMDDEGDDIEDPARWITLRKISEETGRCTLSTVENYRTKIIFGHLLESWVDSDSD